MPFPRTGRRYSTVMEAPLRRRTRPLGVEYSRMRPRVVAAIAAVVAVTGAGAVIATVGGPPSLTPLGGGGLREAHVGTSYAFSYVLESRDSFTVRGATAVLTHGNCEAVIRLLPAEPGWGAAIPVVNPLPGEPLVGRRLTPDNDRRVSVVVTPIATGGCVVGHIRIAGRSWGRDRWADLPIKLGLNVRYAGGKDPRLLG